MMGIFGASFACPIPNQLKKINNLQTKGILGAKDQRTVTSKARPRLLLQGAVQSYVQRVPDKLQVTKKAVLHVFPAALPQSIRLSCLCPRCQLSGLDVPFHAAPTSTHTPTVVTPCSSTRRSMVSQPVKTFFAITLYGTANSHFTSVVWKASTNSNALFLIAAAHNLLCLKLGKEIGPQN
uniref:Uncharacterized protein n=1 Tax=Zea mays TaxID=4577 RepID=A0A804QD86_MAIZE